MKFYSITFALVIVQVLLCESRLANEEQTVDGEPIKRISGPKSALASYINFEVAEPYEPVPKTTTTTSTSTVPLPDLKTRVEGYCAAAGLKVPSTGKDEDKWVTLCEAQARIPNAGLREKTETRTCAKTTGGEILEIRVAKIIDDRCSFTTETYSSGTLLNYESDISSQYDLAIKLAIQYKDNIAADFLSHMKEQHITNLHIATNRDTAMLKLTAKSLALFKAGASCYYVLEGRIRRLV